MAIASALIAMAEGAVYYEKTGTPFFRWLLILQNTIKAFAFQANISLKDASDFQGRNVTWFRTCITYAYALAVFAAPYCTVAAVYRLMSRVMDLFFSLRKKWFRPEKMGSLILFGYNGETKRILQDIRTNQNRVHLVSETPVPQQEQYVLRRRGCRTHEVDLRNLDPETEKQLYEEIELRQAERILLFESSSAGNFSLLCSLYEALEKDWKGKIYVRCEDQGVRQMIQDYCNEIPEKNRVDVELVSLPELQARQMYAQRPLQDGSRRVYPELPVNRRPVHLLILGFGQLGQQALVQGITNGVAGADNSILVDVVDSDVTARWSVFSGRLRDPMLREENGEVWVRPEYADGECRIRLHKMDCRYHAFQALLKRIGGEPFTYVVIALRDPDVSIRCLAELRRSPGGRDIPIALRMDDNALLKQYLGGMKELFGNVEMIPTDGEMWNLDGILRLDLDKAAKAAHRAYGQVSFGSRTVPWEKLPLAKRDANRTQADHRKMVEAVLAQYDRGKLRQELAGLLECRDGRWQYARAVADDADFVRGLKDTDCLVFARMEHRRWCLDKIFTGWEYHPRRDDVLFRHDCLLNWEDLSRIKPEVCKYDLIPLIAALEAPADFERQTEEVLRSV